GGGGNIGRHTAYRLAEDGVMVVVCDINQETAREVAADIGGRGGEAAAYAVDVQNPADVNRVVSDVIERFGKVDILVHSAGGSARSLMRNLTEQTDEVIQNIIGVNLMGGIYFARAAAQNMVLHKSGRIIFVASIVATNGNKGCVEYGASKGGLIGMAKSLAIELGKDQITVNCVSPGLVQRDDKDVSNTNYLGRNGTAAEVAGLIGYLTTDEASFITGQNYVIDGGRSLGLKGSY
ncbi:MAG: SDR family oxidoreductase, partial [Bacillota bacterium]|nr:SDR family oxidoreductase [Bacillota bacterium]